MSTIVAHQYPYVIGVDTHAATHTYAVLTNTGVHIDTQTFPTSEPGLRRALSWAGRRTGGDLGGLWVIEGIGSYGAELTRTVQDTGYEVVEAARMSSKTRRGIGKTDPIDAFRIASTVLSMSTDRLRRPRRHDDIQATLQILLTARHELARERTRAVNALTALLRTIDLGIDARRALGMRTINQIAAWRTRQESLKQATARTEAIRLAQRVRQTHTEIAQNDKQLSHLVAQSPAAGLTSETGIGPVTAATVLAAWAYPGRLRNEAAFAALAGASPLPASSGNTVRYRLNRGGYRQLNRALNVIAMHRTIHDPETQAYVEKRRAQGKTDREIRRCLKHYLARQIYRHLNQAANSAQRGLTSIEAS